MVDQAKLPLPVLAMSLSFLVTPNLKGVAVLEVETDTNPVRIAFVKQQLLKLSRMAAKAAEQCG